MPKVKKEIYPRNIMGNILIYNDEDIKYFHGVPMNISMEQYNCLLQASINNFEELENITLDDTTMKRIARFNKEVDIKKLDKEIEEKKKQIDELDSILQDREGRIDKLKKFIKDIYNINLDDDDDDDYDWD